MSPAPAIAIVTPSYAADLQRCRLLCESMDALAEGRWRHYVLVADHDLALFQPLQGTRRSVIPDSALLPGWLKAVRRPFDRAGRHVWISTDLRRQIRPMSGWHVQQLRKFAAAALVDEDILVMADSDSVFVRPFGADQFIDAAGDVRLYRKPGTIAAQSLPATHAQWVHHAAAALGLPPPAFPAADYINNLVSWRKDTALAVTARVEDVSGQSLALALGRAATISEYQIYGAYMAGIGNMAGHFASPDALSHTYWLGDALTAPRLDAFMAAMAPHQVALCVQSFTETPVELLRALLKPAALQAAHM